MKLQTAFFAAAMLAIFPHTAYAQSKATGLDQIAAYAGNWKTTIVHLATPYSTADPTQTTLLYNECWRSADYYACHQFVDGPSAGLIVFTYNAKTDAFTTYSIPRDGSAAGSGSLTISGDTWTFPWTYKKNDQTIYARVVNVFRGPNTIDYRQEVSTDQATWTVTATGHEERQP